MSDPAPFRLTVVTAGLMPYREALELQRQLHARVVAGAPEAYLVLVEHPPVLTLGKHADRRHLLFAQAAYRDLGIELVETDRGGEVTAHEPGQLVAYPILRLAAAGLAPRSYVALLEAAVIRTLATFGVAATTDARYPGVWVEGPGAAPPRKICALGIRIKERATLHGLALNVANDLALFRRIVPCGIEGRDVTSLSALLRRPLTVADVAPRLVAELAGGLRVPAPAIKTHGSLQWEAGLFKI